LDRFAVVGDDRPTEFVAYTVKGWGTPLAGHKDNHAGLMTREQMAGFKAEMRIRDGHEWDRFEGLDQPEAELQAFLDGVPFATPIAPEGRRLKADPVPVPDAGFDAWVAGFRPRALGQGVAPATFDAAFAGAGLLPGVIERDRNQTEFSRTMEDYLAIAASDERVGKGRAALGRYGGVSRFCGRSAVGPLALRGPLQ